MLLLAFIAGGSITAWAEDITISAADIQNAAAQATTVSGITFEAAKNNGSNAPTYNTGGEDFRIYAKGTLTVSAERNITKMVYNISTQGKKRLAPITASVGTIATQAFGDETVTWTGAASNIVLTVGDKAEYGSDGSSKAGQFDFVSVTVTLEGGEEDTRIATTIEFGDHATEGNVGDELPFPTVIVNDPTGAPVSDAFVVWESSDLDVVTIGDGVIILQKAGTAKITATFEGDNNYKPSTKSYTLTVVDPDQPGTSQDNPYTVAQARAAIDAGTGTQGVYAKGIVSKIVTPFNSQFGNISYNISEDGSETADQLQAYRGFDKDGAWFTSADDVQVGDEVIIYGNLTKYNNTYEFAANNQRVWYNRPTVAVEAPSFSLEAGAYQGVQTVEISCTTVGATIYYTTGDGAPDTEYTGPITIRETTTLQAVAKVANDVSRTVEATYVIVDAGNNSADNPFTVAEAVEFIGTLGTYTSPMDVYVSGTISQVDSYRDGDGRITYWISDDGTTDGQMEVYRGLGLGGEQFAAKEDLSVGDKVTVCGKVKMFNQTPEFDTGSVLTAYESGQEAEPAILIDDTEIALEAAPGDGTISVTYVSINDDYLADAQVYTCNADGDETDYDWLLVNFDDDRNVYYVYDENTTDAERTAYLRVQVGNWSSPIVTLTQAAAEQQQTAITPNPKNIGSDYYVQVSSLGELEDGDALLIVSGDTYAMGEQQTNNRKGVAVTPEENGDIDNPTGVQKLILVMHEGGYYFYTGEDGYLYAASSGSNHLKTEATPDGNAKADISISEGVATIVFQGENSRNVLRFNPNSGNPIFSCYASTSTVGSLPLIYKEVEHVAEPSIRPAVTAVTLEPGPGEGPIDVTYKNISADYMGAATVYTCNADGDETDYDWIMVDLNEDKNIYYVYDENNSGAERTAYLRVQVGNWSSPIVSITQQKIVVDYAEIPFEFNGGNADIATTDGLTQNGLGSDYNAASAPTTRLKFDTTGDWLLLQLNGSPSLLYFDIKGNSFADGTFTVAISKDGEDFESLAEFTDLGSTQTVGYAVPLGYTYIKWEYTEKVSGNVGLGNIQVVENGTEETAVITGAARWASYVTKHPVKFTYGGTYVVTEATATKVVLQEVESAPAGTPVLLSSASDEDYEWAARLSTDAEVTAPEVNLLKASNGNVKGGATIYALANLEHGVGFYNVDENVTIPAGKAYLEIDAETAEAGARPFLAIGDDETTAISAIERAAQQGVQVFDLQGRRVSQPTKGLYIVNGQKVVVK